MTPPASDDSLFTPGSVQGFFDSGWCMEELKDRARFGVKAARCLHEENSEYQKVAVYETEFFGRVLTLDNAFMLCERDEFVYHEMLTHVPTTLHPNPQRALIIGGGDCGCVRELLKHPFEKIVQCEIDEAVTRVCREFYPWVGEVERDRRVELLFEDGFEFIQTHRRERPDEPFDLVIIDSTDPVGAAASLFTVSFYEQILGVLSADGIVVSQTESPHWHLDTVVSIQQRFSQVFDRSALYLGWIPTYPSGMWSWTIAGRTLNPEGPLYLDRTPRLESSCRYWNPDVQRASFQLPNFIRQAISVS